MVQYRPVPPHESLPAYTVEGDASSLGVPRPRLSMESVSETIFSNTSERNGLQNIRDDITEDDEVLSRVCEDIDLESGILLPEDGEKRDEDDQNSNKNDEKPEDDQEEGTKKLYRFSDYSVIWFNIIMTAAWIGFAIILGQVIQTPSPEDQNPVNIAKNLLLVPLMGPLVGVAVFSLPMKEQGRIGKVAQVHVGMLLATFIIIFISPVFNPPEIL